MLGHIRCYPGWLGAVVGLPAGVCSLANHLAKLSSPYSTAFLQVSLSSELNCPWEAPRDKLRVGGVPEQLTLDHLSPAND